MIKKQTLDWFYNKVGETIYRNDKPVSVLDKEAARYFYSLQSNDFNFKDSLTPSPRIFVMPNVCTSCEG